MGLSKLNQLYRQVVMQNDKYPCNLGTLEEATTSLVLRNPSCGDVINVQVKITGDIVDDIKFKGTGCTISMASTSMMTSLIKGKKIQEAQIIIELFFNNIMNKKLTKIEENKLGDAFLLSTVAQFPTRIRCATLGWHALKQLLDEQ